MMTQLPSPKMQFEICEVRLGIQGDKRKIVGGLEDEIWHINTGGESRGCNMEVDLVKGLG